MCGEIKAADEFYSFEAKYKNPESKTVIPADIEEEKREEIRKLAKKAFKAVDGSGLSRIDFFVENETNKVYLNEINTIPGFTTISMYPMLAQNFGINYGNLLDKLIELAEDLWYNYSELCKSFQISGGCKMLFKDYYRILGFETNRVSVDDIKIRI